MDLLLCGSFDSEERDAWSSSCNAPCPMPAGTCTPRRRTPGASSPPWLPIRRQAPLQGLPGLRLIQSLWAGVDRLLDDPSLPDVPLARMVDPAMSAAMAETALWATLSLHRRFFDYAQQQRDRHWYPLPQRRADEIEVAVLGRDARGGCWKRVTG